MTARGGRSIGGFMGLAAFVLTAPQRGQRIRATQTEPGRRRFAMSSEPEAATTAVDVGGTRDSGIGLCLSGGGYRAALFHLGAVRRLNELGILSKVTTVSAVSGGSILAAHLAQVLRPWPEPGEVVPDFDQRVARPFRAFTS